jgi:hypothetical protein
VISLCRQYRCMFLGLLRCNICCNAALSSARPSSLLLSLSHAKIRYLSTLHCTPCYDPELVCHACIATPTIIQDVSSLHGAPREHPAILNPCQRPTSVRHRLCHHLLTSGTCPPCTVCVFSRMHPPATLCALSRAPILRCQIHA